MVLLLLLLVALVLQPCNRSLDQNQGPATNVLAAALCEAQAPLAETGRAQPAIPQLQLPVQADAYSVGQSSRGFVGGTACFQAQRGLFAPKNAQKLADGRSAGGATAYEHQRGMFAPKNAQKQADGCSAGGAMAYEQQRGMFAPKNAQKLADGCSAGGATAYEQQGGGDAGLAPPRDAGPVVPAELAPPTVQGQLFPKTIHPVLFQQERWLWDAYLTSKHATSADPKSHMPSVDEVFASLQSAPHDVAMHAF
ncbi:hypothetical protein TSOC_006477 [Tetrabaena socialis]|uniref:Uncharacterized protein n=1 Tax=Tetrabaena socialis TaxID=47790 RepID=A0A2J8A3L8_9CHLO|nr:hypothetical protein TSOC_006477 [Tetrabaena socialis]|eukprot:PNH07096.1 hypothetical protein TSOC_006477 [Tetrabaena socialis]